MVVSFGGSEVIMAKLNILENSLSGISTANTIALELDNSIDDFDSSQLSIKDVATKAGLSSLPIVRTGYAVYELADTGNKQQLKLALAQQHYLLSITKTSKDYLNLLTAIDNSSVNDKRKKEYIAFLANLIKRYTQIMLYKDLLGSISKEKMNDFILDYQNLIEELSGTYGQGTTQSSIGYNQNFGVGAALNNYIIGKISLDKIKQEMINEAKRIIQNPFKDLETPIFSLFKQYKGRLNKSRKNYQTKLNYYDSETIRHKNYKEVCKLIAESLIKPTPQETLVIGLPSLDLSFMGINHSALINQEKIKLDNDLLDCYKEATASLELDLVAVMDVSKSMKDNDPSGLREQALKLLIDTAENNTLLSVVGFNDNASLILPKQNILNKGSKVIKAQIPRLKAKGGTDIYDGLTKAIKQLNKNTNTNAQKAIILLTDGKDRNWNAEKNKIPDGVKVHSIALTDKSDIKSLKRISQNTEGHFYIINNAWELNRIISEIYAYQKHRSLLFSIDQVIKPQQIQWHPFYINESFNMLQMQLNWPGSDMDLIIMAPDGQKYNTHQAIQQDYGIEEKTYDIINLTNPKTGKWKVGVEGVDVNKQGEPYTLRVTSDHDPIGINWQFVPKQLVRYQPTQLKISASQIIDWQQANINWWKAGEQQPNMTKVRIIENKISLPIFQKSGAARLQITIEGLTQDGKLINRSYDTTFVVKEGVKVVKKKKVKKKIKPKKITKPKVMLKPKPRETQGSNSLNDFLLEEAPVEYLPEHRGW